MSVKRKAPAGSVCSASSLYGGNQPGERCLLVPQSVGPLFRSYVAAKGMFDKALEDEQHGPLRAAIEGSIRNAVSFGETTEDDANVFRCFARTHHDDMKGRLSYYFEDSLNLISMKASNEYFINEKANADIAFTKRPRYNDVRGIMEYKTESIAERFSRFPEAQATQCVVWRHKDYQNCNAPSATWVISFSNQFEIRIGIVCKLDVEIHGRSHIHFELHYGEYNNVKDVAGIFARTFLCMRHSADDICSGSQVAVYRDDPSGSLEGKLLAIQGRVLCIVTEDGSRFALKLHERAADVKSIAAMGQESDPMNNLTWEVYHFSENVPILVSRWLTSTWRISHNHLVSCTKTLLHFWRAGYVHGDIRPWAGNILFSGSDSQAFLIDFEWAGKEGHVCFPKDICIDAFKEYLSEEDLPEGCAAITLCHDIKCFIAWLRHDWLHKSASLERSSELLGCLFQTLIEAVVNKADIARDGKVEDILRRSEFCSGIAVTAPQRLPTFADD